MTKRDYDILLNDIEKRYNDERSNLAYKYACENRAYKIGDIITDGFDTIRITIVKFSLKGISDAYPENVYYGEVLKKDGKPFKKTKTIRIFQSKIKNTSTNSTND